MGSAPARSRPQSASTLAIGATEPVTITLNEVVPTGPWLADITLRSGLTERSARATITFPASGSSAPVQAVTTQRGSHHLLTAVATIAIAVLIVVGGVVLLRRRTRAGRVHRPAH